MEDLKNTHQTKWILDQAHSSIEFKVRHMMIAHVKGSFKTFDADIVTEGRDFTTAEVDLWIDPSSINTGDTKRDEHLRGIEFFDVNKYKQITFTSSTIGKKDAHGNQELFGVLTIKGVSKKIKLRVQFGGILNDPWGNERVGFTVTGKINKNDWGLIWNTAIETGGLMVGEEISISCEIELTKASQKDKTMELEESEKNIR